MKSFLPGKTKNVVGKRIRQARLDSREEITQDQLAGKLAALGLPIDQTAISRIESCSRALMDYEIIAIARALKKPVEYFFVEFQ